MTAKKVEGEGMVIVEDPGAIDPIEDELVPRSTAQRILLVMRDIGNISKSDRNETQNFNYRSVERVVAATRDAMILHGLLCLPTKVTPVVETFETTTAGGKVSRPRRATLRIIYTFLSADDKDDTIDTEIVSEALDYGGDKAVSQALTAAHKAILLQSFQIGDNGSDQDGGAGSGGDDGGEIEYADQESIDLLRDRIALLTDGQQQVVKAAWRRSWGSAREGTIPAALLPEIQTFVATVEAVSDAGVSSR